MTKQEAKEYLLSRASVWQHKAKREYNLARFQRDQYLNGCASNLQRYEDHMAIAKVYHTEALTVLIALIGD